MNNSIKKIDLFGDEIECSFLHKPYNFKRESISENEIKNQFEDYEKRTGIIFKKFIRPYQTHSNNIMVVDETNLKDDFLNVDGLITNVRGIALCTSLADCQGIAMFDKKNKVIGNIHSGWKGTLSRISTNTINVMKEKFNSSVEDIIIYISPCIHKCCFEVDEDLKKEFEEEFSDINQKDGALVSKYSLDNYNLNHHYLIFKIIL